MILKKTINAGGSDVKDVGASINEQLKDYLIETGLFRLVSVETGNGGRPKFILKHINSEYTLTFQSTTANSTTVINTSIIRGSLGEVSRTVNFGSVGKGQITIHIVTNGHSFVFKLFNYNGDVIFGGSCLRYTKFSGEQGYMYNTNETGSWLGYMGRYTIGDDNSIIYQISYTTLWSVEYGIFQECPLLNVNGNAAGYADDIVTINAGDLTETDAFLLYNLNGEEYHGGKISTSSTNSSFRAGYAAAVIKNS